MSNRIDNDDGRPVVAGRTRIRSPSAALDALKMVGRAELAALVGVSTRQISRWVSERTLPKYDLVMGQTKRWRIETVRAWIEGHKKAS